MADGMNKPALRFAGFTDAWEQRKLGELVDRVVRKNTNNESTCISYRNLRTRTLIL